MTTKWIAVGTYADLTEAELDKGILAAAKIPTYLEGAGIVASNNLLTNAVGGIKLFVPEEYKEKAKSKVQKVKWRGSLGNH